MTKLKFCCVVVFFSLVVTSCSKIKTPEKSTTEPTGVNISPSQEPVTTFTPRELPTIIPTKLPTATAFEPLHIEFPTPAPLPVSDWRPPLEEIPWALNPNDHFYFFRPIQVDEINWPLPDYRYGYKFGETDQVHTGVDFDAPYGTPVHAAASGTVTWAGYGLLNISLEKKDPYGLAVTIRHNFGYQNRRLTTVYAHMSEVAVRPGMHVEQGDIIGYIGTTGNTTGPHLHFEIRLESSDFFSTRNPELWLSPPECNGIVAARIMNTNGSLIESQIIAITNRKGHTWDVYTYAGLGVNQDDYYRENLVLSDLPEGEYRIYIKYMDEPYNYWFKVLQGTVTYITFRGTLGFLTSSPPTPNPQAWLVTPKP